MKLKLMLSVLAVSLVQVSLAAKLSFDVKCDRADQLYVPGEQAEFTVTCKYDGGGAATSGVVIARLDNFGEHVVSKARFDLSKGAEFTVRGTLKDPGFLRLTLTTENPNSGSRVWSVGFAPHKIRKGAKKPADFDKFWQNARAKLAKEVPLDPQVERIAERCTDGFEFYGISFATFGRRVYGFMSVPKGASVENKFPVRFSVSAAGLGGWSQDMSGSTNEIRVFMTAYDWKPLWNDLKQAQAKYDALNADMKAKWGVSSYARAGISKGRESCFFYPLILGCDRVIDWVAARPEVDINRIRYEGTSQGGMMGFILTGLNHRILRSLLYVPAGCDHLAYKVDDRQCGWPQLVSSQATPQAKSEAEEWAPYFDAANFAESITCPLRVIYGFSDTTCCPPSVWSAYNACPSQDKSIFGGIGMGHGVYGEFYGPSDAWLRANDARELAPATPESQGVSSAAILRWIEVCEKSLDALHGFVIARHGKVIAEGWWAPQSAEQLHQLYSHSKGFTSSAVGFLVTDGKLDLDERVVDILPESLPDAVSARMREVRVRDLITMNLGSDKDHNLKGPGDWAKLTLGKELVRGAGLGFRYDSDATYLLACIVEKRAGMKLMDFLRLRMFDYLGIGKDVWTSASPQGVACGGWGMNMTTRDLVRFAQLYLQEGRWGDRQVISRDWVRLASACHTRSGWSGQTDFADDDWHRGYGFQFWRCRHDAYRADGANGQYSIMMPKQDAVVSITASLGPMQDEIDTVWNVLLPAMSDKPLPENPEAYRKLMTKLAMLELKTVEGKQTDAIGEKGLGRTWKLDDAKKGFHLKDVALVAKDYGWDLVVTGDFGKQTIPVGYKSWQKGKVKLDEAEYEKLGVILGEQDIASSGAWVKPGVFRIKSQFVATIFTADWTFDFANPEEVKLDYSAASYAANAIGVQQK